jgi:outer membrane protein OmpA-like peptidoglycan-associated protein
MISRSGVLAVVLLVIGCGSTPPPTELVDARAAYAKAQRGPAGTLNPAQLHDAKLALDSAEAAFNEDPEAENTKDLSYIALRKVEWADAQAGISSANADKDKATKQLAELAAQGLAGAQQALQQAQGELSKTKEQLAVTGEQLASEKKAREAAEKRAREAMEKLAMAASLAVKEETRGTVITLPGSVLFPSNQSTLLPAAQEKLNHVAAALKNQDDHKMVVEGHTDSKGNETSNLDLAQRRATSVRDYLVAQGVAADKISAVGIGQGRPVADNGTPDGRAQNRRVEIIVQPIERR